MHAPLNGGQNPAKNKNKNNPKIRIMVHAPRRIWNKLHSFEFLIYSVQVSLTIFRLFSLIGACTVIRIFRFFCFFLRNAMASATWHFRILLIFVFLFWTQTTKRVLYLYSKRKWLVNIFSSRIAKRQGC